MPPRGNSVRAGGAFVDITARISRQFKGALATVRRSLGKLSAGLSRASTRIAVAAGAALLPVVALTKSFASLGDQIAKTAKRTGLSTEAISRLKFAAEQSGASLEDVEKALKRQAKFLIDSKAGLSTNVRAMKALGLAASDFAGLSPEQSFALLSERLRLLKDDTERAARAQEVFGRAGTTLLPLIAEGAAGLAKYGDEAKELGVILDSKAAKAAEDLTDGFNRMKTAVKGIAVAVGQTLAGDVEALTARIVEGVKSLREWILNNKEALRTFVAMSVKALALAVALKAVAVVLATLALLLSPGALIIGGLIALLALIPDVRDSFNDMLDISANTDMHVSMIDKIKLLWLGLKRVILNAIFSIGEGAGKLLRLAAKGLPKGAGKLIVKNIEKTLDDFARAKARLENEIIQFKEEATQRAVFAQLDKREKEEQEKLQKQIGETISRAFRSKKVQSVLRAIPIVKNFLSPAPQAAAAEKADAVRRSRVGSQAARTSRRISSSLESVSGRLRTRRGPRARAGLSEMEMDEGPRRQSTRERLGLPTGTASVLGTFSGRLAQQVVGGQRVQKQQLTELKEQTKSLKAIQDSRNVATFG